MAAGATIKLKRKAGAFSGGELEAGEVGINSTNGDLYLSKDGTTVTQIDVSAIGGGGGGGGGGTELGDRSQGSLLLTEYSTEFYDGNPVSAPISAAPNTLNLQWNLPSYFQPGIGSSDSDTNAWGATLIGGGQNAIGTLSKDAAILSGRWNYIGGDSNSSFRGSAIVGGQLNITGESNVGLIGCYNGASVSGYKEKGASAIGSMSFDAKICPDLGAVIVGGSSIAWNSLTDENGDNPYKESLADLGSTGGRSRGQARGHGFGGGSLSQGSGASAVNQHDRAKDIGPSELVFNRFYTSTMTEEVSTLYPLDSTRSSHAQGQVGGKIPAQAYLTPNWTFQPRASNYVSIASSSSSRIYEMFSLAAGEQAHVDIKGFSTRVVMADRPETYSESTTLLSAGSIYFEASAIVAPSKAGPASITDDYSEDMTVDVHKDNGSGLVVSGFTPFKLHKRTVDNTARFFIEVIQDATQEGTWTHEYVVTVRRGGSMAFPDDEPPVISSSF